MWGVLETGLAVAVVVTLVVVLAACVCGCPKDTHKSELVGTAGVVKLRSEEEAPVVNPASPLSAKRASAQNSQRSLPEIPPPVPRQDSGDTASELYATVGTNQLSGISEQSSPVTTRRSEHPYEHAYARLQDGSIRIDETSGVENAAGASNGTVPLLSAFTDESQTTPDGSGVPLTASSAISGQVSSSRELPYMTPAAVVLPAQAAPPPAAAAPAPLPAQVAAVTNNAQQHFSGDSVDSAKGYTSISVREPLSSIRAQLPSNRNSQPHYSDDSDEMYAAIEDPSGQVYTSGSETYAQIQPATVQATLHAAPAAVRHTAAGAQPAAAGEATTSNAGQGSDTTDSNSRRPTSEGTARQQLPKHSRQASNSSCGSSVGPLGSPKPEKRQANSPLPPPPPAPTVEAPTPPAAAVPAPPGAQLQPAPAAHHHKRESPGGKTKHSSRQQRISSTGDLHNNNDKMRRSLNEKHQRNNSCVSSSDFYGCNYPVDKHRFSSGDLVRPLVARELNFTIDNPVIEKHADAIYNTIDQNDIYAAIDQDVPRKSAPASQQNIVASPSKNVEEMYAKVMKKKHLNSYPVQQERSHISSRLSNYDDVDNARTKEQNSNNVAHGVQMRKKSLQHEEDRLSWTNETKRYSGHSPTSVVPNDGNFRSSASPGKLTSSLQPKEDPGYETIDRIRNKSHGYETIDKNVAKHKSEKIDPGYETVKETGKKFNHQKHKAPIPTVSGGLMQHSSDLMQRGRNSIGNEPGYETLPSGPDSILSNDPGYEHISRSERCPSDSDPNYEVLRPQNSNSPYASIQNKLSGYSVINKKPKVPESSWIGNNNDSSSEPNYESMPHEPIYHTGSESDPNYESVGPKDPNYESVKYFDVAMKEPPYEKVHTKDSGSNFQRTGSSSSGYERVKSILKHDRHNDDRNDNRTNGVSSTSTAEITPVADYFQV